MEAVPKAHIPSCQEKGVRLEAASVKAAPRRKADKSQGSSEIRKAARMNTIRRLSRNTLWLKPLPSGCQERTSTGQTGLPTRLGVISRHLGKCPTTERPRRQLTTRSTSGRVTRYSDRAARSADALPILAPERKRGIMIGPRSPGGSPTAVHR